MLRPARKLIKSNFDDFKNPHERNIRSEGLVWYRKTSTWHFQDFWRLSYQSCMKPRHGVNYERRLIVSKLPPSMRRVQTGKNSPSEHNNIATCASYQSTNAQDPHRLTCEWKYFDKARCYLNHIYHISVAKALGAECCSTGWGGIQNSYHGWAITITQ